MPPNTVDPEGQNLVAEEPKRPAGYGSINTNTDEDIEPTPTSEVEDDDDTGNTSAIPEEISPWKVAMGIALVITAGFAFTASNIIQKFYVPSLTFWQLLLHRAIVQFALMLTVCVFQGLRNSKGMADMLLGPAGVRTRTVVQGILGGILLLSMFNAIKHVPLGNSSAIMFCTPVFTFMLAPCMLREHCGIYRSAITIFMIFGVALITRPPFIFDHGMGPNNATNQTVVPDIDGASIELLVTIGYICAVCVPLLSAIISILTRQCKHVPPYLLMFWFGTGALIVSTCSILIFRPGHLFNLSEVEWLSTGSIIVLGLVGNLCYTFAVRWVSPSKANVFRSFEVILNFVLQIHFEHTKFYPENAVGIVFLIVAVFIMAFEREAIRKFGRFRFF